jgi:hypothetical protein
MRPRWQTVRCRWLEAVNTLKGSGILAREEATGRGKFLLTADAKAPGFCRQRLPGRVVRQDRLASPCDTDVGVTGLGVSPELGDDDMRGGFGRVD